MPTKIISTTSAEHYKWGGQQGTDCDGWHLVKTPDLSIIEELMPAGTSETRHSHVRARQFFYILEGELTLEVEHHHFVLHAHEGIEVSPGQPASGAESKRKVGSQDRHQSASKPW